MVSGQDVSVEAPVFSQDISPLMTQSVLFHTSQKNGTQRPADRVAKSTLSIPYDAVVAQIVPDLGIFQPVARSLGATSHARSRGATSHARHRAGTELIDIQIQTEQPGCSEYICLTLANLTHLHNFLRGVIMKEREKLRTIKTKITQ